MQTVPELIKSSGELETKTGKELVEIYNRLCPEKPVKKFETHATGVRRVLAILAERKPEPKVVARLERKAGNRRPFLFDTPRPEGIKSHRAGTKRAKLVEMLTHGATFEECMAACSWSRAMAYQEIKICNSYLGYVVTEDPATRVIRLVKP